MITRRKRQGVCFTVFFLGLWKYFWKYTLTTFSENKLEIIFRRIWTYVIFVKDVFRCIWKRIHWKISLNTTYYQVFSLRHLIIICLVSYSIVIYLLTHWVNVVNDTIKVVYHMNHIELLQTNNYRIHMIIWSLYYYSGRWQIKRIADIMCKNKCKKKTEMKRDLYPCGQGFVWAIHRIGY